MKEITREDVEKIMKGYYDKLGYLYAKANTKSKLRNLNATVWSLKHLCGEEGFDFDKVTNIDFSGAEDVDCQFFSYIDNVNDNIELLKDLSLRTIYTYYRNNYPYYKRYTKTDYVPFTTMHELLKEFFNSFDDESINRFIKNMTNNHLYVSYFDIYYAGALYDFSIFNKYVIHINSKYPQNLYFASSLAHEMGHAYEAEQYYNVSGTYLTDKHTDTIFYEIVSSFFEYAFIKFLKENNYYPKEIDHELDIFYLSILRNAFGTYSLCVNGVDKVDDDSLVELNNKDQMDKVESLKNKLNYYEQLPSYGDKISIYDSIVYFLGKVMAVNLYDKYKNNPKEFMKNFRTALTNYPRSGSIDSFEVAGISKDEVLTGRVLRKELNRFTNK